MTKKVILITTLLLLYFYYFISSSGINCSNDGGHYGLASALYHEHTSQVDSYKGKYVRFPDFAVKDGQIYADRLPGTAFLIIPYLAYGDLIINVFGHSVTDYDVFYVTSSTLLANLMGTLGAFLIFLICYRAFNFNFWSSWLTMMVCAIATTMHLESTHLFSHAPSLFIVTLSIYIVISKLKQENWVQILLIVSALIGFSAVIELQNILFYFPILGYVFFKLELNKSTQLYKVFRPLILSVLMLVLFASPLIIYNYMTFGEWMLKSNYYNPNFQENTGFISSLSGNPIRGIDHLFTNFYNKEAFYNWSAGIKDNTPGLLVASPIFIVSLLGFIPFYRKRKFEAVLFASVTLISVTIAAFHSISLTRHIFTIQALLFLPAIFAFDWLWKQRVKVKLPLIVLVSTLIVYSFLRQLFIVENYYGRDHLRLFANAENINIFMVFHLPVVAIITFYFLLKRMKKS